MSIAALLTMPKAKGLFQKAIMESGASQTMQAKKRLILLRHFWKRSTLSLINQIFFIPKRLRIF